MPLRPVVPSSRRPAVPLSRRPVLPWSAVLLVMLLACDDPTRPTFPGSDLDTLPPSIEIVAPLQDTVVAPPAVLWVSVVVRDVSGVDSVLASVSGVVAFLFPPILPRDTMLAAQFPIPTANVPPGSGTLLVEATDALGNRASKALSFIVQ